MTARRLTAWLLLAASGAAQNCARPHLGATSGPVHQNAREKAFDALDDNEDIDVTWKSKRRYAQYLDADTGACDGIEWGGSDDGCYALRPDGAGLDLAGLRAARRGTNYMKSHGYAPREEDVARLPNVGYGWARGPRQKKRSGGLTTLFGGGGAQVQPADQPYEAVDATTLAAVRTAAEAESMIFVVHADMLRLLFTGFLCQKGFEPDEAKIKIVHEFPMIDNFEQHLEGLDLLAPSRIQDMRSLIETLHEQPVGEVLAAYPLGTRGDVGLQLGASGDATRDLTNAEHALVIRAAASSCKALAATDDGKKLYDTTLEHYRLRSHFHSSSSIGSGGSGAVDQCIDIYERTPPSKQGPLKRNLLRKLWSGLPELLDDAGKVYTRKGGDARARTKRGFTKLSLWPRAKLRYFAKDADRASNIKALEQLLNDIASVAAKDLGLDKTKVIVFDAARQKEIEDHAARLSTFTSMSEAIPQRVQAALRADQVELGRLYLRGMVLYAGPTRQSPPASCLFSIRCSYYSCRLKDRKELVGPLIARLQTTTGRDSRVKGAGLPVRFVLEWTALNAKTQLFERLVLDESKERAWVVIDEDPNLELELQRVDGAWTESRTTTTFRSPTPRRGTR